MSGPELEICWAFYVPSDYTEAGFAIQFFLKFTWE
jgi:hypothetical protein